MCRDLDAIVLLEREPQRMDKDYKLQRYSRKDYTDLVDFPVEIVGRDGVVRRYSFEDSIRLYQRRITFAPIRYRDTELVDAEVTHCRSRIDQLRRSYFHRFGWGTPEGEPEPLEVFGDLAGELAAFLCRVMHSEGRPDVVVRAVETPRSAISTWYVLPAGSETGMVLYVYRFEEGDEEVVRERFFALLKELERVDPEDGDRERMLAFHHTVDCGLILTARAGEGDPLEEVSGEEVTADLTPTPWEEALEVIRRGDFEEGMERCRDVVRSQPWHRGAYVAGAVLAAALRRYFDAEDFALLGSHYFPDDAVLHHYVGLSRYRLGRLEEAEQALRSSLELSPNLASARFVLANVLLDGGNTAAARALLAEGRGIQGDNRRSEGALQRMEQWLRWRGVMTGGAAVSFVLGLLALLTGGLVGLVPIAMSLVIAAAGILVFRRQLEQLRARQRYDELSRGLRQVHRRVRLDQPPVS
jgi:tetratricopeptide (TPR) repeat protein